jgi:hypothetical protein
LGQFWADINSPRKADWVDPLVRRSDPILDTPEPEAPSYWRF